MKKQHQDDPWSQLVSDLGLEDAAPKTPAPENQVAEAPVLADESAPTETPEPVPSEKPVECSCSESAPPTTEASVEKSAESKKTFFGRFPKINLFGNPSKDTLEAVVEGSKTPSLSGKSFTSKTLEKVPLSPKRDSAEAKRPERKEVPTPVKQTDSPKAPAPAAPPAAVDASDPWSQIASQVGILSVAETRETIETAGVEKTSIEKTGRADRGRGRKNLPSMFDDETPTESEESRALKNLIEDNPDSGDEAAKRLRSLFDDDDREVSNRFENEKTEPRDEKRGSRRRGRRDDRRDDRRREPEQSVAAESSNRDDRNRDDDFDAPPARRGRGARYVPNEERSEPVYESRMTEEEADDDFRASTWDIEEESKPVERSSRGRRRRGSRVKDESRETEQSSNRRPYSERDESDTSSEEDFEVAQLHRNIPSWDEAIALIIDGNVARRNQRSSESRRGRR